MDNQRDKNMLVRMRFPGSQSADVEAHIAKITRALGFEPSDCRIHAVLSVQGPVVDPVSGDVLLERAGLLALVEHRRPHTGEIDQAQGRREVRLPHLQARMMLLTFADEPDEIARHPTVWIL